MMQTKSSISICTSQVLLGEQHTCKSEALLLRTAKGCVTVAVRDLVRIEGSSAYSRLHFREGRPLLVAKVLRWFEERLAAQGFVRVNRSNLVNVAYLQTPFESEWLRLACNMQLKIPRRRKIEVSNRLTAAMNEASIQQIPRSILRS